VVSRASATREGWAAGMWAAAGGAKAPTKATAAQAAAA
jgi:hypothetical protein